MRDPRGSTRSRVKRRRPPVWRIVLEGRHCHPSRLESLVLRGGNARLADIEEAEDIRMTQPLQPRLPQLNIGQIVGRNGWDLTFENGVGLREELSSLGLVQFVRTLTDQVDEFLVREVHVPVV